MKVSKPSNTVIIILSCLLIMITYFAFFHSSYQNNLASQRAQRITVVIESLEDHVDLTVKDDGAPIIAILLDGINLLGAKSPLNLDPKIALGMPSYIPYETYASNESILQHNLLFNIPMEPINYPEDDPDPQALITINNPQDNLSRLNHFLSNAGKYSAFYSSYDEKFTASLENVQSFLEVLKEKKIIYLSGLTDKNALIYQLARKIHFFVLENDIILDSVISREEIIIKLLELENLAKKNGSAIALGGSYPLTVELLNEWMQGLADKGIKILPIKEFYAITAKRKALLENGR